MSDTVSLIEELRERLDRIERTQGEIQDGRARLAHYEKGTMALSEAVEIMRVTLEGQERANATYGDRLDSQCRDVAEQVQEIGGTLAELQHDLATRRKAEDKALESVMKQVERFDPNVCISDAVESGGEEEETDASSDEDDSSDESDAPESTDDDESSDEEDGEGGIGSADGHSG